MPDYTQVLNALIDVLKREQAALRSAQASQLAPLALEKEAWVSQLTGLEDAMQGMADSAPLLRLLRQVRDANVENGSLISQQLAHTEQALGVLQAAGGALYDAQGRSQSATGDRINDKA